MGRLCLVLGALLLPLLAVAEPHAGGPVSGTVVEVFDGDTFVLSGGERVRLLDINTPERARDMTPAEAYSAEARAKLTSLVQGKAVTLKYGPRTRDAYERLLAHVYLNDGTWVNGEMVKSGMAHVYSFADNRLLAEKLMSLEVEARAKGLGIWQEQRWGVREAATCCAAADVGRFMLVRGTPIQVLHVDDRTYMNFGKDWKTDFTVYVMDKDMKWFKKAGVKDLRGAYMGKPLLVRGFTQPVNGVMVRATHPEQLEVMK